MYEQLTVGLIRASFAVGGGTAAVGVMGLPHGVAGEWATVIGGLSALGALLLAVYREIKKRKDD